MALSACQYCGRQNDSGAQFCTDCGKPLTKAAAARAAVAAGGGGGVVSRTSGPTSPGGAPADAPCPLCGSMVSGHSASGGGGHDRRSIPDRRSDHSLTLVLVSEMATEVARFERKHTFTTIGRTEGDIQFPEDQFLSPLHAKLSWEEGRLDQAHGQYDAERRYREPHPTPYRRQLPRCHSAVAGTRRARRA